MLLRNAAVAASYSDSSATGESFGDESCQNWPPEDRALAVGVLSDCRGEGRIYIALPKGKKWPICPPPPKRRDRY